MKSKVAGLKFTSVSMHALLLADFWAGLFVPTIENGTIFVFGCVFVFSFFVFQAKSGSTINNWNGLSDISY